MTKIELSKRLFVEVRIGPGPIQGLHLKDQEDVDQAQQQQHQMHEETVFVIDVHTQHFTKNTDERMCTVLQPREPHKKTSQENLIVCRPCLEL